MRQFYYAIPKQAGEGWARIWLTSDGCFTCLSDYGHYGHWWGSPGCEFRKFLTGIDSGYLIRCLHTGKRLDYDQNETERAVRAAILQGRRDGSLTKDRARDEWEIQRRADFSNEYGFYDWHGTSQLDWETRCNTLKYCYPGQLEAFAKRVWPRFVLALRAELIAEKLLLEEA